jgi:hypothetical protein
MADDRSGGCNHRASLATSSTTSIQWKIRNPCQVDGLRLGCQRTHHGEDRGAYIGEFA